MKPCSTCPHPAKCREAGKCLKQSKTSKTMGSGKGSSYSQRMNDVSKAQMNKITFGLLYPESGPEAYKRAKSRGDMR